MYYKDDLNSQTRRKTRAEMLEERIEKANRLISSIQHDLTDENIQEIERLKQMVSEFKEMKKTMEKVQKEELTSLDKETQSFKENAVLEINLDKMRIIMNHEEDQKRFDAQKEIIKKLESKLSSYRQNINELLETNNEIMRINQLQEEHIQKLKSKAYGYDIASKFEAYKTKQKTVPEDNKIIENDHMSYNFWEKENINHLKQSTRLDDMVKEKEMWIGNSNLNLEKLKRNVNNYSTNNYNDYKSSNPYGNVNSGGGYEHLNTQNNRCTSNQEPPIGTNMRKYSPLIINSKKSFKN